MMTRLTIMNLSNTASQSVIHWTELGRQWVTRWFNGQRRGSWPKWSGFDARSRCVLVAQWGATVCTDNNCDSCYIAVLCRLSTRRRDATANSAFCLSGSVNEDQLWLVRQRHVWSIPFVDKRVGVQVKLWNPSTTRAIPEHLCSEVFP